MRALFKIHILYMYIYKQIYKPYIYPYIYIHINPIETIKKIVAVLGYCHCCLFKAWRSKNKTLALPHAKWKALLKLRKVVLDAHGGVTMEEPWSLSGEQVIPHMLHVWYIYLHNWVVFRANVGKYSIHGAHGYSQAKDPAFQKMKHCAKNKKTVSTSAKCVGNMETSVRIEHP